MKAAKIIVLAWTAFCVWGLFDGFANLDPDRVKESDAYAAGAGVGLFLWVMVWGILVVPIALIGMLFRKKETDRRSVEMGNRVKCPFCAELIRREAKVCPHCPGSRRTAAARCAGERAPGLGESRSQNGPQRAHAAEDVGAAPNLS